MDTAAKDILIQVFREKAAIGLHIDLQQCYGYHNSPHFIKADKLSKSLRNNGLQNVWTANNGYNSRLIQPNQYKPVIVLPETPRTKTPYWRSAFQVVEPKAPDVIFSKLKFDAFKNRHLRHFFEEQSPQAIVMTGVTWYECMLASARGALKWKFGQRNNVHVFVAHDASNSRAKTKAQKETLKRMYVGTEDIDERRMSEENGPLKKPLDASRLHIVSAGQVHSCMELAMAA